MKFLLVLLVLSLLVQPASGQLSGKLIDNAGQPISAANVLLLQSADTSLVKAAVTDEQGVYQIQHNREGKYILQISSIGYDTWNSLEFELTSSILMKDFGTLVMKKDPKSLEEVVVRSAKPLIRQDAYGVTVNVENSLLTKGSSALQVLEQSPGVVVDRRNGDIALNGKSGVMVMLNGKLVRMSMSQVLLLLDGMSADDISKVELLTTPPPGYDAEGSAGLINIVLKKTRKKGTNGSVSVTAGYGLGEKGTGSINLTHNVKKINLYGSYAFSRNRTYYDLFITSAQDMPGLGGKMNTEVWNKTNLKQNNHDARAGIDYTIDPATTIGGSISWNSSDVSTVTLNRLLYNILPDSLLSFNGAIRGSNHWRNMVSSVYLERQLSKSEKVVADLDYIYFTNDNPSNIQGSFVNKDGDRAGANDTLYSPVQQGFANTAIKVVVGKIDYTKQWNEKIKLDGGIKSTYTTVSSLSGIKSLLNGVWENRNEIMNTISMEESIGAVYASMSAQLNKSVSLVAGARYEYAHTHLRNAKTKETTVNRKMGVLFPGIFLTKKLNDQSDLQLSYTKRISRPTFNDLASFVSYSDPSAVLTGNPFLKPTINTNIKLGYNYKSYSFSFLFSRDRHPIARYQLTESLARDLLFVSPQNLAWQNNFNFQTNIPVRINKWWDMNYSLTGGWRHFKLLHTRQPVEKKYIGYSVNFSQSFKLPHNFSAELSGWYVSDWYSGSIKGDGFGIVNGGLKKELKGNGGSLQLSVSDILRTMRIHSYFGAFTEEAFSIKNHVRFNAESRKFPIIRISYSRSLGSGAAKSQRKQNGGSDEERERIRRE